ncbi:pyridoxal 5'-phosphate synthase glutaminase subunit PdxT [Nocardioides alkalitolerans]|uniref:pyridoxal 5'-phosphate synthase glutaminase subunit PdxT n=1 Tax=Nocardioides alkalitolerans TaxID=281714 RepID=UPI0003FFE453|nr:pyridoxal 5'-phosphate synthase glutaminase subunit PdxT [Nocardioides alkalitolerans]
MTSRPLRIGVLALQGDVREHVAALTTLGVDAVTVRREPELETCDGLVLPGGESTTIGRLARQFEMLGPLRAYVAAGRPVLGTCAGMVLLADRVLDGTPAQLDGSETLGGLDVTVRRNAFGRQVDSFETTLALSGVEVAVPAVFIRAPWVESVGPQVEVLARVEADPSYGEAAGRIVAVRQGALMATSFHPEIGGDPRVHRLFVESVRARRSS